MRKKPLLCRLGLHDPDRNCYITITRRRSDAHGGKYHANYAYCRRCGKLAFRVRLNKRKGDEDQ